MSEQPRYPYVHRPIVADGASSERVIEKGEATWEELHRKFPGLLHALLVAPETLRRGQKPANHVPWCFEVEEQGASARLLCSRKFNGGHCSTGEAVSEVTITVENISLTD